MRFLKRHGAVENPALSGLGHLEIAALEVLWKRGESSVHQVMEGLERALAYTTVMTTLDRLYKKGFLDRRKSERAYFYSAQQSRQELEHQAAKDFVAGYLVRPPAGELLISCLVDAVGKQNAELLDDLEKKIRLKRRELDGRRKR